MLTAAAAPDRAAACMPACCDLRKAAAAASAASCSHATPCSCASAALRRQRSRGLLRRALCRDHRSSADISQPWQPRSVCVLCACLLHKMPACVQLAPDRLQFHGQEIALILTGRAVCRRGSQLPVWLRPSAVCLLSPVGTGDRRSGSEGYAATRWRGGCRIVSHLEPSPSVPVRVKSK